MSDSFTEWLSQLIMRQSHRANLIAQPHMIVSITYEGYSVQSTSRRRDAMVLYAMDKEWYPEPTEQSVVRGQPRIRFQYLRRIEKEGEAPEVKFFDYWHYMVKSDHTRLTALASNVASTSDEFKNDHNKLIGIVEDFVLMPIDEFTDGKFSYI